MSNIFVNCPCCDGTLKIHVSNGDSYRDYSYPTDLPIEFSDQIDNEMVECESCTRTFTLTAKVVTKKVLELGVKL